ncbi:hypothetical protein DY000_02031623 [Brassica cretica]|uniref:Aspartic peptidase DDI1-type domain-containing protein n=1 Tax=Brassica cretica TaxID=69181 RepID=A0ABQ7DHQ7_BRACR|nr:hypothetical protein DY000_02031623 [Brassica cretica]
MKGCLRTPFEDQAERSSRVNQEIELLVHVRLILFRVRVRALRPLQEFLSAESSNGGKHEMCSLCSDRAGRMLVANDSGLQWEDRFCLQQPEHKFETLGSHVKKIEIQVVQTGDAIRRQEASTRGVGDDVMMHHVNAIIEDDFWQVVKEEKLKEGDFESTASCNAVKILSHEEFAAKHPHPPKPDKVRIDRHANNNVDRHSEADIDRHPSPPINRRAPITYRVQMLKIDVARLNALRPKPKPSEQPPDTVRTPSVDGDDPMEEDRVSTGRTLRRRKEKVARHLKRGLMKRKRKISKRESSEFLYISHSRKLITTTDCGCSSEKPERKKKTLGELQGIEFPHALCDTGASARILPRVMADHLGLKVESSQELFTFVDCSQKSSGGIVRDLEVQIGNALVPVDFHVLDIKLNWNSSLLLGRAFLSTVGAVCNLQTNQLCLTLIDPNAHYDPIPVKKPHTIPRRINDPGIIAACHCGAEYESDYSESIDTKLELLSTTWESFLVNSGSSVQLANQPVVSNTHRS